MAQYWYARIVCLNHLFIATLITNVFGTLYTSPVDATIRIDSALNASTIMLSYALVALKNLSYAYTVLPGIGRGKNHEIVMKNLV